MQYLKKYTILTMLLYSSVNVSRSFKTSSHGAQHVVFEFKNSSFSIQLL